MCVCVYNSAQAHFIIVSAQLARVSARAHFYSENESLGSESKCPVLFTSLIYIHIHIYICDVNNTGHFDSEPRLSFSE